MSSPGDKFAYGDWSRVRGANGTFAHILQASDAVRAFNYVPSFASSSVSSGSTSSYSTPKTGSDTNDLSPLISELEASTPATMPSPNESSKKRKNTADLTPSSPRAVRALPLSSSPPAVSPDASSASSHSRRSSTSSRPGSSRGRAKATRGTQTITSLPERSSPGKVCASSDPALFSSESRHPKPSGSLPSIENFLSCIGVVQDVHPTEMAVLDLPLAPQAAESLTALDTIALAPNMLMTPSDSTLSNDPLGWLSPIIDYY